MVSLQMLRHVAMFRWKDNITDEQKHAARDALAALKKAVPSVVDYTVGFDIERNPNNWDMVLVADFEDVGRPRGLLRPPGDECRLGPGGVGDPEGDHRTRPVPLARAS